MTRSLPPGVAVRRPAGPRLVALAALVVTAAVPPAAAQPAGASSCSGCHAPAGTASPIPSLAGRPAAEIVAAVAAFRAGSREATVMDRIAKGFSDEESRAIAEWLAAGPGGHAAPPEP
jgi:sulfide dehydrogenase cytochrome subunit